MRSPKQMQRSEQSEQSISFWRVLRAEVLDVLRPLKRISAGLLKSGPPGHGRGCLCFGRCVAFPRSGAPYQYDAAGNMAEDNQPLDSDQVGTERVRTDPTGAVNQTCTSMPYGDSQSCTSGTMLSTFASYDRDAEYGLAHAPARYYSPTLGRFMTPDPLGGMAPGLKASLARTPPQCSGSVRPPSRRASMRPQAHRCPSGTGGRSSWSLASLQRQGQWRWRRRKR